VPHCGALSVSSLGCTQRSSGSSDTSGSGRDIASHPQEPHARARLLLLLLLLLLSRRPPTSLLRHRAADNFSIVTN